MRGCALREVVRNLAHEKLENRGVEPQHLPSQIPRPAPTGCSPVSWWMAEKPGAEGNPGSPGEKKKSRERERELGTGILFEEPNPTGSRPRDLIGLHKKWQSGERPQPAKRSSREEGGATGAPLRRGQP